MSEIDSNSYYDGKHKLVSRKTGNRVIYLTDTSRMFGTDIFCDSVNYDILNKKDVLIYTVIENLEML